MSSVCLALYPSPLGKMTLASIGGSLVGAWFEGQRHFGGSLNDRPAAYGHSPALRAAIIWLDAYFTGVAPLPCALPPLAPQGTEFQHAVWRRLLHIPYGRTTTYGALAADLRAAGIKASAQAVGGAVGRNPLSIIIPCHRVLGAAGELTGYAGGIEKKQWLLRHEQTPII